MLPEEAIAEYKGLYKQMHNIELDDAEASLRANNIVDLYQAVFGKSPSAPPKSTESNELKT